MTLKEKRNDARYINGINYNGNTKLQPTENVRFWIWNLPAVTTCPFATEACKKCCYACKAEKMYPSVLPRRMENYETSRRADFAERMIYTIETELNTKAAQGKKIVFRIHESGDFYDFQYYAAWVRIAAYFVSDPRIIFIAYTKSVPFTVLLKAPKNLVVRASIWCDTTPENEEISRANYPIYTAYDRETIDAMRASGLQIETIETIDGWKAHAEFFMCRCSDCGTCGACYNPEIREIFCIIH